MSHSADHKMKKQIHAHDLVQQWERAVQEARENNSQTQTLAKETLDAAAGLNVKTRVRVGLYPTQDVLSTNCCTGHNCL